MEAYAKPERQAQENEKSRGATKASWMRRRKSMRMLGSTESHARDAGRPERHAASLSPQRVTAETHGDES
eukprot:scaffold38552_cov30-Tisochrysis_lutea.AAC.6